MEENPYEPSAVATRPRWNLPRIIIVVLGYFVVVPLATHTGGMIAAGVAYLAAPRDLASDAAAIGYFIGIAATATGAIIFVRRLAHKYDRPRQAL